MVDLLERWRAAAWACGGRGAVDDAGQHLLRRWGEPHRRYHDLRHLAEVLDRVDALEGHARRADVVRVAAFCHDAVYDPARADNEERSSHVAGDVLQQLAVPRDVAEEVRRLVLLTRAHEVGPGDVDGEVLCDADLGVLAADPTRYAQYAADVREEYAAVPDAAFRAGRADVLARLLQRPRLFRTPLGSAWEDAARTNVTAELTRLRTGPS